MGPPVMVVIDILAQYLAKVVLIEHNDVVEDLSAKCADQPFHERIGRRRQIHLIRSISIELFG